ncbi:MAG: DUF4232 domain-containing protein [Actinomycetota bacterium]|nr:DUF4232 domain-containing protein [Actinomycetota bacterium]MDQ6945924.1 DUF4232 domain-containing protein [Actinomycetota bacterium]
MTDPDRPEIPTSTSEMLERTRRRAQQLRRRRRTAVAAVVAVVVAVAIAVPAALINNNPARVVKVVNGTTTTTPPPTAPPAAATTPSPTNLLGPAPTTTVSQRSVAPTTSPSAPTTATVAASACTTNHLSAHLGNSSGAAGSVGYDVTFVNIGPVSCSLDGYPGVSYVTAGNGTAVGAPARRTNVGTVATVVLGSGQTARAMLIETDSVNYPQDTCQLTSVTGLRVYPPNQTASLFVTQPARVCANPADPVLQIGPVQGA